MLQRRPSSEELYLLREIARWTREAALPIVRDRVQACSTRSPRKGRTPQSRARPASWRSRRRPANHEGHQPWIAAWIPRASSTRVATRPRATFPLPSWVSRAPARRPPEAGLARHGEVTDEHLQARVQRIEADVHALYRMTSMRDGKQSGRRSRHLRRGRQDCIILRGVQKGLSGPKIAGEGAGRSPPAPPTQQRVSETLGDGRGSGS